MKKLGIINVDLDANDQLLIIYSAFVKYLRKKLEYNEAVHQLFTVFKKAYDTEAALHNNLTAFGIPMKLVRLIRMCLNENYSTIRVGKQLSDMLTIRNGLKQ
jgi:hypothetical protein